MSSTISDITSISRRIKPTYYDEVQRRAQRRWEQLEADPELLGPWKQLFEQVQSPRHVLSELLQNADDAGARHVCVLLNEHSFEFEHDGLDFDEEHLASLCRFGFSNKRKLYTIGFRGVGFKSTFSLGDNVEVLSPSLAVCFNKKRFTEPNWLDDAPTTDLTRISVGIQDPFRKAELEKNLQEWVNSPTSLLFFRSICELTINGVTLRKEAIGEGPVEGSERIRLTGTEVHDVIVFRSSEEPFPDDAVAEVLHDRGIPDLDLPPCQVELVVGLPAEQRLYVVLPTGVHISLPFSCNAAFLQEPSRSAIKTPSISPTNRWLLKRLGNLAGLALSSWLMNTNLSISDRAQAYSLLPGFPEKGDSLGADVTTAIFRGFVETTHGKPLLLSADGLLVSGDNCIAPPMRTYSIWPPSELLTILGDGQEHILSETVEDEARKKLSSLRWIQSIGLNYLIEQLANRDHVPRPESYDKLLILWEVVQRNHPSDYYGSYRQRLSIVPVDGQESLMPCSNVIRLPPKKETIGQEPWMFLMSLLSVIDPKWISYLSNSERDDQSIEDARQLLHAINLDRTSDTNTIAANACRILFGKSEISIEDCVKIAHLMATLDAKVPDEFRSVTKDNCLRNKDYGVIAVRNSDVEDLFPEEWVMSNLLHDAYFSNYSACTEQRWKEWIQTEKSGFYPFVKLNMHRTFRSYSLKREVRQFIKSRGGPDQIDFYVQVQRVEVSDFGFPQELIQFWNAKAREDVAIWAKITERIMSAQPWYWRNCLNATLVESNFSHSRYLCEVKAEWIEFLSGTKCLFDMQGRVCVPSELYLRTPATEPLMNVEPFVRAEIDKEATKNLLRLLGVRDSPAGLIKLLERIRALANAPNALALLREISKWYDAIDRAIVRCDTEAVDEVARVFRVEKLILTESGDWVSISEVFQYISEDDPPDTPVIHPAAQGLSLWTRIGVAERPSVELILHWLDELQSESTLDGSIARRVRSVLKRYPVQVWEQCGHWLSLDNVWNPVNRFKYRLTMRRLTKWNDLFPSVKNCTADLQMLGAEMCDSWPFSCLQDIGGVIEHHLVEAPRDLPKSIRKPWLATLGGRLQRISLPDDELNKNIRDIATRLVNTTWQPFKLMKVAPYIHSTQAGSPYSPDALWVDYTLYVKDGSIAGSFTPVVHELARFFNQEAIVEALKACFERDDAFIDDYMKRNFKLLEDYLESGYSSSDQDTEEDHGQEPYVGEDLPVEEPEDGEPVDEEGDALDDEEENEGLTSLKGRDKAPRKPKAPPLMERYALSKGFHWEASRNRFLNRDGSFICKCDPPFNWVRYNSFGHLIMRYWASQQCLNTSGIELDSEVWELIIGDPSTTALLIVDPYDNPQVLTGETLLRMKDHGEITLCAAKYRIKMEYDR